MMKLFDAVATAGAQLPSADLKIPVCEALLSTPTSGENDSNQVPDCMVE